ncbi:hypothetical protein K438DRAFT_2020188 [Mycena galopus ATCC 62051]|nr:hypothetical protein K438DRAFT_2020188 [Mycena galopus ATCC 62051]
MSTMLYESYSTDIDMHHTEPWFDTEAKMEDDIPHFTDHDSTLSVEVDMDDSYQEIEYEMADGEGEDNYDELLDIEVHDAEPPLEDATLPPADAVNPHDSHTFATGPTETLSASLLPVAASPAMSPFPDTDLPDAASEHVEAAEEVPVDEENVSDEHPEPPVDLVAPLAEDANVETLQPFRGGERAETGVAEATPAEDRHPSSGGEQQPESGITTQVPQPEEHHLSSEAAASDSREVDEPVAGDPHEISDGVYIDPPPAVLVSFESSDFPDICLFNQPARSRSPSPSEGREQANQVFDLLLHHRPILYYEPLASVFEALRQEELLAWIPHLADSELVIDAYDLQLVISEDNVYAREVTLHDLNVLHDGSDIAGPLRLRLKSVLPRFILRYHLLQDQVSRLNLVAAGDEQEPSTNSTEQAQAPSDPHQQNVEPQLDEAQDDAHEKASTLPTSEKASGALEDDQRQENPEAAAREADSTAPHLESDSHEENVAEEYAEPRDTDESEGYGEKIQHEEVGGAETTEDLPAPPEEDDEEHVENQEHVEEEHVEEEEFVVLEAPGAKPVIPLTGGVVEDTGNELETSNPKPLSDSDQQHESKPSGSQTPEENVNNEDVSGVLADNSVDSPTQDGAFDEGESYEDGETQWEDAVEDEDPNTTWDAEEAENETASNESSVTLSSKASKRSFDELEPEEDEVDGKSPPGSPGAKRTRVD